MSWLVAVLALSLQQAPAPPVPQSPTDCLNAARELSTRRLKELGPVTSDTIRQVTAERLALLRECAARFDSTKIAATELAPLVNLYIDAQQVDLAQKVIERGLADPATDVTGRANLLMLAIRTLLRQPKSDARNATAEQYMDRLDSLRDAPFDARITAHSSLNGYYRADDIDSGIIKHSTWIIDAAKQLQGDERRKYTPTVASAYVNLAEAVAGQGDNDRAVSLLKTAIAEWSSTPAAAARTGEVLKRYELVGTAAPVVSAPVWLNREGSAPLDLKGKVTLLQFTAHWCGPCKESYPGMKRMLERFGKEKFQTIFYTRTYGYFESERNLTPEQEIDRDKKYFAGYGFSLPIAVGPPSSVVVDGKPQFKEDPMEQAFAVGGIPQINVIDREGKIRLVMIGYDDANEEKLAAFIEKLLKERIPNP